MEKMTIGILAKKAGVGIETVRFYQRKDLIRQPQMSGSVRTYNESDIQRIVFIKKAQELGFSLAEIKELLELNTKPRVTCGTVKKKTIEKIKEVEMKISDLEKIKESLMKLASSCDASQDKIKQYKVQECFNMGQKCDC